MPDTSPEREAAHRPGRLLYLSLGLGLLWILLAFNNPATHYHLGPPLVALAVPLSHRSAGSGPLSNAAAAGAAVSGLMNALFATAILAFGDKLQGAPWPPFGNATAESVVLALGGAAVGFVIGVCGRSHREQG